MADRVKVKNKIRHLLTWDEVIKMMAIRGWQLATNERAKKVWRRGKEEVRTFRTFEGHWKTEFFYGTRLQDSTGESDEFFAKAITLELAAFK